MSGCRVGLATDSCHETGDQSHVSELGDNMHGVHKFWGSGIEGQSLYGIIGYPVALWTTGPDNSRLTAGIQPKPSSCV